MWDDGESLVMCGFKEFQITHICVVSGAPPPPPHFTTVAQQRHVSLVSLTGNDNGKLGMKRLWPVGDTMPILVTTD
jgi:hypothetical protein